MNWRKTIISTLVVIALLLAVGGVGGYVYLQSDAFREFAMRKIVEQADQATGGRTQIGDLDFQLSTLTTHLHDVVIRGTEPANAAPLLRIDRLTVSLKILSFIHR